MGIEVEKVKVRETEKYEMYNEAEYWSVCWNKGGEKRVFGGRDRGGKNTLERQVEKT